MTTLATRIPVADPDDLPDERRYHLSPAQFRKLTADGVFPAEDRVVLVDGLLRQGGADGPLYRLTLDQYHRMDDGEGGLEHVELLGGWLLARTPINSPHRRSTRRTRLGLERATPPGYYVDQNAPSSMPRTSSEPHPDVQIIRGDEADYDDHHPQPADIALVVEVSDSTLSADRNYQLRIYARESIPVYWIVNLVAMRLEVYIDPSGPSDRPGYANRQEFGPEDEVPLVLDGREVGRIAVRDLLP